MKVGSGFQSDRVWWSRFQAGFLLMACLVVFLYGRGGGVGMVRWVDLVDGSDGGIWWMDLMDGSGGWI